MKIRYFCCLALAVLATVQAGCVNIAQSDVTAFVDVNVVPMGNEAVLAGQTVIVRRGLITDLGPASSVDVPPDARRIDGRGLYLLPGLMDMHVHLQDESSLPLCLAYGVTTILDAGGSPEQLSWRQSVDNDNLLGPLIFTSGPCLDGSPSRWPGSVVITTQAEAEEEVQRQKEAGYDFIMVYDRLSEEAYGWIIEAAKKNGLPVIGHLPAAVSLTEALQAGQVYFAHLFGYYAAQLDAGIEEIKASKTWICPTLTVDPNFELCDRLNEAGVSLILGTDAGFGDVEPGLAVHDELKNLVKAGLTPYEAISCATRNSALFLHRMLQQGTVQVGKRADLLLVKGNPLDDVSYIDQPAGVMVRGRWLPEKELEHIIDQHRTGAKLYKVPPNLVVAIFVTIILALAVLGPIFLTRLHRRRHAGRS